MGVHSGQLRRPEQAIAVMFAATLLALSGCESSGASSGRIDLTVSAGAAVADEIAAVRITVGPGGGPAFTPFELVAARAGAGWTASTTGIPAGVGRAFDVAALRANGTFVYAGAARADIVPNQAASVVVVLQAPSGPPVVSDTPAIYYVVLFNPVVEPGGAAAVAALARDDQYGTPTYLWSSEAGCGAFDAPTEPATIWLAPASVPPGDCMLTIRAQNVLGNSTSVTVPVKVVAPTP